MKEKAYVIDEFCAAIARADAGANEVSITLLSGQGVLIIRGFEQLDALRDAVNFALEVDSK